MCKFDLGKSINVWQGRGALPMWIFPYKLITGAVEFPTGDNCYHWRSTEASLIFEEVR